MAYKVKQAKAKEQVEDRSQDNFKMAVYEKDGTLADMGYYATEEEAEKDFENYDKPKGRTHIIEAV